MWCYARIAGTVPAPAGRVARTSRTARYHQFGTCTPALETGHHSAIGAVATSRRKCAPTPQVAPAAIPATIPAPELPEARYRRWAVITTTASTAITHSALV